MLSLQTLNDIEALLMSRNDPRWGEFMFLANTIAAVQAEKKAITQLRPMPAAGQPIGATREDH